MLLVSFVSWCCWLDLSVGVLVLMVSFVGWCCWLDLLVSVVSAVSREGHRGPVCRLCCRSFTLLSDPVVKLSPPVGKRGRLHRI